MTYGVTMKQAGWFWKTIIKLFGLCAITTPWGKVYILPEYFKDEGIIIHEQEHLNQIERMGWFKFSMTYVWFLFRYGYANHPLEIEARQMQIYGASDRTVALGLPRLPGYPKVDVSPSTREKDAC